MKTRFMGILFLFLLLVSTENAAAAIGVASESSNLIGQISFLIWGGLMLLQLFPAMIIGFALILVLSQGLRERLRFLSVGGKPP